MNLQKLADHAEMRVRCESIHDPFRSLDSDIARILRLLQRVQRECDIRNSGWWDYANSPNPPRHWLEVEGQPDLLMELAEVLKDG